jgi:hypothetical protein
MAAQLLFARFMSEKKHVLGVHIYFAFAFFFFTYWLMLV